MLFDQYLNQATWPALWQHTVFVPHKSKMLQQHDLKLSVAIDTDNRFELEIESNQLDLGTPMFGTGLSTCRHSRVLDGEGRRIAKAEKFKRRRVSSLSDESDFECCEQELPATRKQRLQRHTEETAVMVLYDARWFEARVCLSFTFCADY